jgi:hypothetical protein
VTSQSKANASISNIEDSVVLAHEDIAKDPQRASGLRNIHSHDAQQAHIAIRNQVVLGGQSVSDAVDDEVDVRQLSGVASGQVLAGNDFLSTTP